MECSRNNYSESTSTNSHSRNQINSFSSSGNFSAFVIIYGTSLISRFEKWDLTIIDEFNLLICRWWCIKTSKAAFPLKVRSKSSNLYPLLYKFENFKNVQSIVHNAFYWFYTFLGKSILNYKIDYPKWNGKTLFF